jgi:hypothetical protein
MRARHVMALVLVLVVGVSSVSGQRRANEFTFRGQPSSSLPVKATQWHSRPHSPQHLL